ncbi:uncharacterized protein LOC116306853 [Actinia tenebrosa]|uniref:Uncharacterized protein LOC116306853 n=1 Tax=Actinia tenebrosa TaxID=6105 RepID=A0A6P8J667_ACTTE|nr:uncharacterized protein LOC116306853 [Actinia tenebrosa]
MDMMMFVLTLVLFGAYTVVHTHEGNVCSDENLNEILISCMKSFVCGLKKNYSSTCSYDKVIDCIYFNLKLKNCTFYGDKEKVKWHVPKMLICEFGGVDVSQFFLTENCYRNASYCTDDFQRMWRNNMTDPRLNRQFEEMKFCLKNLSGSKECNVTISNLEDVLVNPFEDCWDSGSTTVFPRTTNLGSPPTRPYGLLSAFSILIAFILALF